MEFKGKIVKFLFSLKKKSLKRVKSIANNINFPQRVDVFGFKDLQILPGLCLLP